MKVDKTNALRILDKANISYVVHTYAHEKEAIEGVCVAALLNKDPRKVYKTLLCISNQKKYYVFIIPVKESLDLKKCAKTVHEKSVEMIPVKDITKVSGYVRGGCSPIGMKKQYSTIFHETCISQETIIFSGGKIGLQVEMKPSDLMTLLPIGLSNIIK